MIVERDSELEDFVSWPEEFYRKVLGRMLLLSFTFILIPLAGYISYLLWSGLFKIIIADLSN